MKVLVCGTSIALPKSGAHRGWVYFFQKKLKCEIVNLSRAGCGNQYVHDAVVSEITERKYDLVIVSWPSFNRVSEVRTRLNPEQEDWAVLGGNPHADFVQKGWLWDHIADTAFTYEHDLYLKNQFFECFLPLQESMDESIRVTWMNVLSVQSMLKCYNIPYLFTFPRKVLKLKKHSCYYEKVDWSNVDQQNLYTYARNKKLWVNRHPTEIANEWFAQNIYDQLSTKNLIVP